MLGLLGNPAHQIKYDSHILRKGREIAGTRNPLPKILILSAIAKWHVVLLPFGQFWFSIAALPMILNFWWSKEM